MSYSKDIILNAEITNLNKCEFLLCRYLSGLLILRLENNSVENGPLIRFPSLFTSPESLQSGIEGERQGKTVNSVASMSRPGLESLEVRRILAIELA